MQLDRDGGASARSRTGVARPLGLERRSKPRWASSASSTRPWRRRPACTRREGPRPAPLHADRLRRRRAGARLQPRPLLKLRRIICPLGAGVMSALGFLVAAPATDMVRSYVARLDDSTGLTQRLFARWRRRRARLLVEAGADAARSPCAGMPTCAMSARASRSTLPVPDGVLAAHSAAGHARRIPGCRTRRSSIARSAM